MFHFVKIFAENEVRTCLRYFTAVLFIGVVGCWGSLLAIWVPQSPRVFTSLATRPGKLPLFVKVLTALLHLLINSYVYYALWLQNCTTFLFAQDMRLFIRSEMSPKWYNYGARDFVKLASKCRALTVLQAEYASIYRHWIISKELLDIIAMILNIYQAVAIRNYRAIILVFAVAAVLSWILQQLAGVYEEWKMALHSWQTVPQVPKWGRIFLRSCRPIGIPVGSFFYVDRGFMLTVLSIVINNSATLILAYGQ